MWYDFLYVYVYICNVFFNIQVHIQLKNNNQCRKRKTCDSWASIEGSEKAGMILKLVFQI